MEEDEEEEMEAESTSGSMLISFISSLMLMIQREVLITEEKRNSKQYQQNLGK